jgi:RNA-directed DNA polymerase
MRQQNLFYDEEDIFGRLCSLKVLRDGFKAVRKNHGSPGIDGVSIEEFESLKWELEGWKYKPQPVKRVEIPKPGKDAGVRLLGVPCIRDRVVQAALKQLLEPILDPKFSDNSYGFRPGRNQPEELSVRVKSTW